VTHIYTRSGVCRPALSLRLFALLICWCGLAAVPVQAAAPTYQCVNPKEGKGRMSPEFGKALDAVGRETVPDAVAAALADLARLAHSPLEQGLYDAERGRLQSMRGDDAAAIATLSPLLGNPYLSRAQTDRLRVMLAALHLDRHAPAAAIELLQPMAQAACAPLPGLARQLLAQAYVSTRQPQLALAELDALRADAVWDTPRDREWLTALIQLRCRLEGASACVRQVAELAQEGGLSDAVIAVANQALAQVADDPAAADGLAAAQASGLIDAQRQVIPRAPEPELTPVNRVAPRYPREAARRGISGYVRLKLVLDRDGRVTDARVVDSSPKNLFEAASLSAARSARFTPGMNADGTERTGYYTVRFMIAK